MVHLHVGRPPHIIREFLWGIIGGNNLGIMGVKFEKEASPIKVQSLNEQPRVDKPGYNGRARSHGHIGQCRGQPVVV